MMSQRSSTNCNALATLLRTVFAAAAILYIAAGVTPAAAGHFPSATPFVSSYEECSCSECCLLEYGQPGYPIWHHYSCDDDDYECFTYEQNGWDKGYEQDTYACCSRSAAAAACAGKADGDVCEDYTKAWGNAAIDEYTGGTCQVNRVYRDCVDDHMELLGLGTAKEAAIECSNKTHNAAFECVGAKKKEERISIPPRVRVIILGILVPTLLFLVPTLLLGALACCRRAHNKQVAKSSKDALDNLNASAQVGGPVVLSAPVADVVRGPAVGKELGVPDAFCTQCGEKAEVAFCGKCGASINGAV